MAKKPKDKPRARKLKVFRTPIGFHDAYVAATSQKAALEAWGADSNIFAQGIAEEVNDPKLMEEPLGRPGEVIKRVRGSADEHFAELAKGDKGKKEGEHRSRSGVTKEAAKAARPAKLQPRPSRAELDAAEEALEKAEKKQRKAVRKIDERIQELERERRELQRKHEAERDKLSAKADAARSAYEKAMRGWKT